MLIQQLQLPNACFLKSFPVSSGEFMMKGASVANSYCSVGTCQSIKELTDTGMCIGSVTLEGLPDKPV